MRREARRLSLVGTLGLAAAMALPGSALAAAPASSVLRTGLPNRTLTPGAFNPAVTQATIQRTICVSGYTATIRPPESYTEPLKRAQIATYGYADQRLSDYEEDHLVSLEIGGSARSPKNLWPEPHHVLVGGIDLGSYTKDKFENYLHREVCVGAITLARARHEIAANWVAYWKAAGEPKG